MLRSTGETDRNHRRRDWIRQEIHHHLLGAEHTLEHCTAMQTKCNYEITGMKYIAPTYGPFHASDSQREETPRHSIESSSNTGKLPPSGSELNSHRSVRHPYAVLQPAHGSDTGQRLESSGIRPVAQVSWVPTNAHPRCMRWCRPIKYKHTVPTDWRNVRTLWCRHGACIP
jgi:hypothetical protein